MRIQFLVQWTCLISQRGWMGLLTRLLKLSAQNIISAQYDSQNGYMCTVPGRYDSQLKSVNEETKTHQHLALTAQSKNPRELPIYT